MRGGSHRPVRSEFRSRFKRRLCRGESDRRSAGFNPMPAAKVDRDHHRKHLKKDRLDDGGEDDRPEARRHEVHGAESAGRANIEQGPDHKQDSGGNQKALDSDAPGELQLAPPSMRLEMPCDDSNGCDHLGCGGLTVRRLKFGSPVVVTSGLVLVSAFIPLRVAPNILLISAGAHG